MPVHWHAEPVKTDPVRCLSVERRPTSPELSARWPLRARPLAAATLDYWLQALTNAPPRLAAIALPVAEVALPLVSTAVCTGA